MAAIDESLSRQFYDWEVRGRGWSLYENPVRPEPAFRPFEGHFVKNVPLVDDGSRPTILGSLFRKIIGASDQLPEPEPEDEPEPEPEDFEHSDIVELRTTLPAKLNIT